MMTDGNVTKRVNVCDIEKFTALGFHHGWKKLSQEKLQEKRKKYSATCLDKYGCENGSASQEVKDKIKSTCLERYGVENPSQCAAIQQKKENTCLLNFGVNFPMQSNIVKERTKESYVNKFGVENNSQLLSYHKAKISRYVFDGKTFDSLPELSVFVYFKASDIHIERCTKCFEYEYLGVVHKYFPDFEIDGKLIEIKGDHFFENGVMINPFNRELDGLFEAKHKCMLHNNVEIWTGKDYKKYVDGIY